MQENRYDVIHALVYFTMNFPDYRDVIHWIAEHQHTCNEQHLLDKIEDYFRQTDNSATAWLLFYCGLGDNDIRRAFCDYVMDVYYKKNH